MDNPIPRPSDMALLLDIDGTLVNADYNLTSLELPEAASHLQQQGWRIGLSSDSPLELMRFWKDELGFNGDLVAERGALVETDGEVLVSDSLERTFQDLRESALSAVSENFPTSKLWSGNPVEAIRQQTQFGNPGETVILLNEFRRCSFGIFVRYIDENGAIIVDELTQAVAEIIKPFYQTGDFDEDLNYEHGLLIVGSSSIDKRIGSITLMEALGIEQFGMVGNSKADYVGSDIAVHYAVDNASPEFKEVADYVSPHQLTHGVKDVIERLSVG